MNNRIHTVQPWKEMLGLNLVFNQFGQILAKFTCKPNATKFANWL